MRLLMRLDEIRVKTQTPTALFPTQKNCRSPLDAGLFDTIFLYVDALPRSAQQRDPDWIRNLKHIAH
jgi:hypothetical protein